MSSLVDKFQTVHKRCAKWKTLWKELTPRKHFLERLERFCQKLGEVTVLYFYTFQSMSTQTWNFGGKELEAGQKRRSPRILRDVENLWGLSGPCHQGAHAGNIIYIWSSFDDQRWMGTLPADVAFNYHQSVAMYFFRFNGFNCSPCVHGFTPMISGLTLVW